MPAWILSMIIPLAIRLGVSFVLKRFPGIPPEVRAILESLQLKLKTPGVSNSGAKKQAVADFKAYCEGTGCPTGLK